MEPKQSPNEGVPDLSATELNRDNLMNKPLAEMTDEEAMVAFCEFPGGLMELLAEAPLPPAPDRRTPSKEPPLDTDSLEFGPSGFPTGLWGVEEP